MDKNLVIPNNYIVMMAIIYVALFMGPVFFGAIAYYIHTTGPEPDVATDAFGALKIVMTVVLALMLVAGLVIFNLRLKTIREKPMDKKLPSYQGAFITRLALVEGSALFAIIVYLVSGDTTYIVYAALTMALYLTFYPTRRRVRNDLGLDREDFEG
jgi:MFS family permease